MNVANLLLARSSVRQHEVEIRLALGATRRHILQLVLAEALVISVAASLAAVALAYGGLQLLKPLIARLSRADELTLDLPVLIYTLLLGAGAALLFGMVPAMRSMRTLRTAGMTARATSRTQRLLISGEVALAFVLLVGAGLLIRTFVAIRSHDLGYDPRNVLTSFLALPPSPDGSRARGAVLYARIRERVAALSGVQSVATASNIPMFGVSISMTIHPEGEADHVRDPAAFIDVVSGDCFRVMRIPLRAGRTFTSADRAAVIVSESVAHRYFGGAAIGRRLFVPGLDFNIGGGKETAAEIVGVAGNVCVNSVEDCQAQHVYLPEAANAMRMETLLVRTKGEPLTLARAVRHAVYQEAPSLPLDDLRTLEQRTSYLTDAPQRGVWLLGVFACLALSLAAAGIYAVSSYIATQRRREIAIRVALGATAVDVARLVSSGVLLPASVGLVIGAGASLWLTRLLQSLLFGVSHGDPATLALAALGVLATAVLAAAGPALRGASADPVQVLRGE